MSTVVGLCFVSGIGDLAPYIFLGIRTISLPEASLARSRSSCFGSLTEVGS